MNLKLNVIIGSNGNDTTFFGVRTMHDNMYLSDLQK